MEILFILVAFLACLAGSICGIGGGVIMKPVFDAFHVYSVSTISFMSGCIVLAMSAYSVLKAQAAHDSVIEKKTSLPLGLGAAVGGVAGKELFNLVKAAFDNADTVGAVQAAALFFITLGVLIYTLKSDSVKTRHVQHPALCVGIGIVLGVTSSFLGIGGGPINLAVLYYFFSMDTKTAAQNSLYVILLSQCASLVTTLLKENVPSFPILAFCLMVAAGILGGMVGRKVNKRIEGVTVSRLFIALMIVILGICCWNFVTFLT